MSTAAPAVRRYEVVAMGMPIDYNAHGDHDHHGMLFALRRNHAELTRLGATDAQGRRRHPGPHDLVRPLVLRACKEETVEIEFWNHLPGRSVGLHLVGGGYDVRSDDGARVGANPDTTVPAAARRTYRWRCDEEGVFVFHDTADLGGGEDGSNLHGLFGVLVVEPAGTVWRDSSGPDELTSERHQIDGLYVDVFRPGEVGKRTPWLADPPRHPEPEQAFREFVIVVHDEPAIVNHAPLSEVAPPWAEPGGEHGGGGHGGVPHVMPMSYRAEPMLNRERILWSRLRGVAVPGVPDRGPVEVPVVNEEQHHSSWMFGDPATPVLHAYLGDPVRIRLVHCGVKEIHVFHLHLYEWHADDRNHGSPLIDAITISPQTGHTIEPLWGAGNRQLVPGDVIWHCHLYPHFHHGMWGLMRTFDRRCTGADAPEQRYPDGSPMAALRPLPDCEPPPGPAGVHDGWPRFMRETRTGGALPAEPAGPGGAGAPEVAAGPVDLRRRRAGRLRLPPGHRGGEGVLHPARRSGRAVQHRTGARLARPVPGVRAGRAANAARSRGARAVPLQRPRLARPARAPLPPRGRAGRRRRAGRRGPGRCVPARGRRDPRAGARGGPRAGPGGGPAAGPATRPPGAALLPGAARRRCGADAAQPHRLPDPRRRLRPRAAPAGRTRALGVRAARAHGQVRRAVRRRRGVGLELHERPRPGYRLDYRWWADEEFGVIFTHDHLFANYRQKRGLFGAMIVEPAGSRWFDPHDPASEIVAGEQAVVVQADGSAFREIVVGGLDFVPLLDRDGVALNPPAEPTRQR